VSAPAGGGGRREAAAAVAGCLAGAALTLSAGSATWLSVRVAASPAAAPLPVSLSGGTLAPAATAFGLAGLAAVAALAATRGIGRQLTGVLLVVAGAVVLAVAGRVALDPAAAARGSAKVGELAAGGPVDLRSVRRGAWPWLSASGGLLLLASGLLVAARGRRWAGMSARYAAPGAGRPAPGSPRAAGGARAAGGGPRGRLSDWDAIERGEDPTLQAQRPDQRS
jgi:uncharacterized membrane protein (TIGR02234 family)